MSTSHLSEDVTFITTYRLFQGNHYFSLFSPALLTTYVLRSRGHAWAPKVELRSVYGVPGLAAAVLGFGSLGFILCAQACGVGSALGIHIKRLELESDVAVARRNRYGWMGYGVGGILSPLVFRKRANLKVSELVYVGGALGTAMGVLTHHGRLFWERRFAKPDRDEIERLKKLREEVDEIMMDSF